MKYRKSPESLGSINFRYDGVDCEYERNNNNCRCEDYCRCATITNAHVTSVNTKEVTQKVAEYLGVTSELDVYCVNRILSSFKVYNNEAWDVRVCGGYYGEEIGGIFLKQAYKIEQEAQSILALKNSSEKVEAVLTLEYGYLLDILFNCRYYIKTIDRSKICYQREHYTKLDRSAVEAYKDYSLPRGIVQLQSNGRYRLIDGYHRIAASTGQEEVKVIVAKESND